MLAAESRTTRRPVDASAHDCVRFLFVRDGSMILSGDCPQSPVVVGDVALIAPNALVGYEPEGWVDVTTLLIDMDDYLIEHLFWQHLDLIPDRDAARDLAAKLYPDPVQCSASDNGRSIGSGRSSMNS